jgi:hypothetical protein
MTDATTRRRAGLTAAISAIAIGTFTWRRLHAGRTTDT